MAEPGAAPADVPRKRISGRPRIAVRSNYVGLPLMAGRGAEEGRRKLPGSGRAEGPPSAPGSTAPRTEIAARGAPGGVRVDRKTRAALPSAELLQRLSALRSPHVWGARKKAAYPAPIKTRVAERWLLLVMAGLVPAIPIRKAMLT